MVRENRYAVVKWRDIYSCLSPAEQIQFKELLSTIKTVRENRGQEAHNFVVISDTLPIYEHVWQLLEECIDGSQPEA